MAAFLFALHGDYPMMLASRMPKNSCDLGFKGLGSRGLGFRGYGLRGLGFRGYGLRGLGLRGLGLRGSGLGVLGIKACGFRGLRFRVGAYCKEWQNHCCETVGVVPASLRDYS